jgi:glucosamine--fructose-6-phosphate aminotransferase (isomerizing)
MIAARKGSPLAIGYGEGEMFVGSDAIALAPMTDRITYLEEGDWAVVTRARGADLRRHEPPRQPGRDPHGAGRDPDRKGRLQAFHGQGNRRTAGGHRRCAEALHPGRHAEPAQGLDFKDIDRVTLVACGTASYACHVAKYWFEQIAGLPCRHRHRLGVPLPRAGLSPASMAIFVSQSGETADTLAALRHASGKVAQGGLGGQRADLLHRPRSDLALPILAGVEVGVASTKAFTCQLTVLALMALKAAQDRGRIDAPTLKAAPFALSALPGLMNRRCRCRTRSPGSPRTWPRRRTSCSLAAGRCSRWPWKAR